MSTRIEVEIGELFLEGFGSIDSHRMRIAFETELGRLLAAPGVSEKLGSSPDTSLERTRVELPAVSDPSNAGVSLGHAVLGTLLR